MHLLKVVLLALATVVSLGACSGGGSPKVEMASGQRFAPEEITASAGDAIVFTNTSSEAHSVTAYSEDIPDGADYFPSGNLESASEARDNLTETPVNAGDSFEVTLTEPGTYRYF